MTTMTSVLHIERVFSSISDAVSKPRHAAPLRDVIPSLINDPTNTRTYIDG